MAIKNQIQFRRGSSSEWIAISGGEGPALYAGEPGFDLTNNLLKIGDGSTPWKDLQPIGADQSLYKVKNTSGGIIYKGQVVRANGTVGGSDAIQITTFIADGSIDEHTVMGLATQDMLDNDFGYVTAFGQIRGVDTDPDLSATNICATGETWLDGDILYASPSVSGKLTKVKPQHETIIAIVLHSADNGSLFVRPTWYPHIDDLHDVNASGVSNNQYLIYNSGSGLWLPTSSGIFEGVDISSSASGATLLSIEGTNGNLFSVVDSVSGSLLSVNDITGLPAFEVFSDHSIVAGRFNQNDFVVSSGGNIGIGTDSPIYKLHIYGSGNDVLFGYADTGTSGGKARIYVGNNDSNSQGLKVYVDKTSGSNFGINGIANGSGAIANYGVYGYAAQATTNFALYGYAAGGTVNRGLWVDAGYGIFDDRVGIGTSSPSHLLSVSGVSTTAISIETPWAAGAYGQLRFDTSVGTTSIRSYVPGNSTNGLQFYTYSGSETVKLTILGDGKVGIGTISPSGNLDVYTAASVDYGQINCSAVGVTTRTHINVGNSDSKPFLASVNGDLTNSVYGWGFFDRGTDGNLALKRKGGSTSWTDVLTVQRTNGHIGIGATSPTTLLDVSGVITATGGNSTNWNTAYSWGNHASAGYQSASTALTTSTSFGGDVSGSYNNIVVADDSHNHIIGNVDGLQTALDGKLSTTLKGANNGLAELDSGGKVPSSQLPSYVDDVLEYAATGNFPATGETGKIYVATGTNLTYRWSGSAYVEISASLALGETSSTAYRGDRGKTAYDHSQLTTGSVHGSTTVGGNLLRLTNPSAIRFLRVNADNTVTALSDSDFRTAIGAGTSSTTGTVTSVGGTGTVAGLTLTGTVTTTGNLTLGGTLSVSASNFSSQTANTFLAAPNGSAGTPTFRAIVAADIPTLNQNTTGSANTLSSNGGLTTQYGDGKIGYSYLLPSNTTGLFTASDNSNCILTLSRHSGNYYSQLGFSSNGNLYYRAFTNTAINTTQAWQTIWTSSSLTNLNQLTNGPGYTTNTGTVTSVAALTLGTTGTDVSSTVTNGTTTPVITLNIPTASASNRGALSSTDWTTFNNKQAAITGGATTITSSNLTVSRALVSDGSGKVAVSSVTSTELGYVSGVTSSIQTQLNGKQATLTNPVTGTGTTNYVSKWTSSSAQGNSVIYDNGTNVGIGTTDPGNFKLRVSYAGSNYAPVEFNGPGTGAWGVGLVIRTTGGNDGAAILFRNRDTKNWQIRGETSGTGFQITEDGGDANYGSGFGTPRVHISAGGNVGIGTTTPSYKLQVNGSFGATTKSFRIDHPSRPNYTLEYGSLESPYHGVRLTGRGRVVKGVCVVDLPPYLKDLIHDDENINIQLTNLKHGKTLYVSNIDLNNSQFTVKADRAKTVGDLEFFWTFSGVRKDVENLVVEKPKEV